MKLTEGFKYIKLGFSRFWHLSCFCFRYSVFILVF